MTETEHTEESAGFGLDKDTRLEAKRAAEAEDEKPEPLDPPFPYWVIAFDPVMVVGTWEWNFRISADHHHPPSSLH